MALKEMTGDYFSWLSHDDVYYPEKIEEEVKYLEEHNLVGKKAILYSDYDLIDKDSILITKSIKPHKETVEKPEYDGDESSDALFDAIFGGGLDD
jgi:hypothetical protein